MRDKKDITFIIELVIVAIILAIGFLSQEKPPTEGVIYSYDNNYKHTPLKTKIETKDNDGNKITIEGDIFNVFEDPLSMKNEAGEVLAYAGDAYNLLTQNDHGIYVGDAHICDAIGEFKLFGDSYTIKNADNEQIAYVKFNASDTVGKMYDNDGKLLAQYNSGFFRSDYEVYVFDTNMFSENVIQMIFAAYVSDKEADR